MNMLTNSVPLLSTLIILPIIGAIITAVAQNGTKKIALFSSIIQLLLSFLLLACFDPASGRQFVENCNWVPSMGISYSVGADGISVAMILLTTVLTPLIILSSFNRQIVQPRLFFPLILLMQSALIGVFVATDGFLFYIFWELALIPIYLICLNWGGADRQRITLKFFIYTLFGSLLMLVALIWLSGQTTGHSFSIDAMYALKTEATDQTWIFWALFIAFAIKMPVFPFHTWQPDTYTDAPTQGTMLLSGIMLKMGIYGLIRWMLPITPIAMQQWGPTAIALAVIGIVYASLIAWKQKDFKRLIAYSSIAHIGMIAAGVFSLSREGIQGSVLQMLSHGVNVVGLFMIADIIVNRVGTREADKLGGIRAIAPAFATTFLIILLASVALPLTNGFVGEFLLMNGIAQYSPWVAAIAGLSIILGAVYMLSSYKNIMLGPQSATTQTFTDLNGTEKIVLYTIVILIFFFGIYPEPIIKLVAPSVEALHQTLMSSGALSVR
jgi:NADH-quinone oxidoreductase subunit M